MRNSNPEALMSPKSESDFILPAGTVQNGVLIGADDTLFLAGGAHSVLEIASSVRQVPEKSFEIFGRNISDRDAYCRGRGARNCSRGWPGAA